MSLVNFDIVLQKTTFVKQKFVSIKFSVLFSFFLFFFPKKLFNSKFDPVVFIKKIKQKQKIQLEPCNMKLFTTKGP